MRQHKDLDLHKKPWSETLSCCGTDDTKHEKYRTKIKGRKYVYYPYCE